MSTSNPNTLDSVTDALQSYIVSPLNAFGIGGFLFDIPGEAATHLTSEITDHYAEDNHALQDHIAIRPEKITLKGYVGELVYNTEGQSLTIPQQLTQKLTTLTAYLPLLSASAQQVQQTIQEPTKSSLSLSDAANIFGAVKNFFTAGANGSKQSAAYQYFKACWQQGILMGIQTPWEFMTSMAIESIVAIQDEVTQFVTDFSITFKQVRIAKTLTTAFSSNAPGTSSIPLNPTSLQGAASYQAQPETTIGNVPGLTLPTTFLPGQQGLITGVSSIKEIGGLSQIFSMV